MAGPLGVRAFRAVQSLARGTAKERRAATERQRGGEGRVRRSLNGLVRGGPPKMLWKVPVVDAHGNPVEVRLVPARVEPAPVTVPIRITFILTFWYT